MPVKRLEIPDTNGPDDKISGLTGYLKKKIYRVFFLGILFYCLFISAAFAWPVYPASSAPQSIGVSPNNGTSYVEQPVIFRAAYRHSQGAQKIRAAFFFMGSYPQSSDGALFYYDRNQNKLFLRDESNRRWLGGFAPGSDNIIENSYARIDCKSSSVALSGEFLNINWAVAFKRPSVSPRYIFLNVRDDRGRASGWKNKGIWRIFIEGALIGPQGGEVSSPDRRVKLVIPAGALTRDVSISVSLKDQPALQLSQLSPYYRQRILSVVEFQPRGLVFRRPAQVIYTLPGPQVPGTRVSLGLYDGRRIAFQINSFVNTDSYTANFQVNHFSTYAVLKGLAPQGPPIGMGVKIPLPDMFTGAFSHSIPITVAPGRKGIQPNLALTYRSSNPNSWTGVGFSLNPGYIVRSTRLGPPTYNDTQDTFYFVSDGGTTELVHLVDNLYQARIESSFTKFFKESDDSWRVVGKDGSVMCFGQSADSREGSDSGTFSWYITKAQDTNANYIQYSYIKDQGKAYLRRIDYTGNENTGVSPANSVEFFCQPRTDISSSYITSSKIVTDKLLTAIESKVGGELVWRYELKYTASPDTNRSLLQSVTQYGSDNKSLPTQVFEYQKAQI